METRQTSTASMPQSTWTWIMLAVMLILGVVVGAGVLAIINFTQRVEEPVASQPAPVVAPQQQQ